MFSQVNGLASTSSCFASVLLLHRHTFLESIVELLFLLVRLLHNGQCTGERAMLEILDRKHRNGNKPKEEDTGDTKVEP